MHNFFKHGWHFINQLLDAADFVSLSDAHHDNIWNVEMLELLKSDKQVGCLLELALFKVSLSQVNQVVLVNNFCQIE
jgi:hypothetical protein